MLGYFSSVCEAKSNILEVSLKSCVIYTFSFRDTYRYSHTKKMGPHNFVIVTSNIFNSFNIKINGISGTKIISHLLIYHVICLILIKEEK